MPSSYCFVLDFNFCRPCVIVRELVVLLLQACLSVVIVFLACSPSQSCYIKLCSYFCPFYFLLRLLQSSRLPLHLFGLFIHLHVYRSVPAPSFPLDQFILPVLFKIRLLAFRSFSFCVFSFCFVLARLTPS